MPEVRRRRGVLLLLFCLWAGLSIVGIRWGLPSGDGDDFLFASATPPQQFNVTRLTASAGSDDPSAAADVDPNPADTSTGQPVPLNDTDQQRAEILCRYRLYSAQPDEMITFRALQKMHPEKMQLDPRLYQYGGLWIYPIGGMIKLAGMIGWINVSADKTLYIAQPEQFAPFYIVARAYSAAWGWVAVWAVFTIVRRLTRESCTIVPTVAALCFMAMPVVINAAHEAKPHLAGVSLILLSVLAAANYVQTGKLRWMLATGLASGAAMGIVLSGVWALAVIPVMAMVRRDRDHFRPGRLIGAAVGAELIAIAVYAATNPYVVHHLLFEPAALRSNLSNTQAMYHVGSITDSIVNSFMLLVAGTSPLLFVAGVCGAMALAIDARKQTPTEYDSLGTPLPDPEIVDRTALLLVVPAVLALVAFVALSAGKPPEYARFALLPDALLAIFAGVLVARIERVTYVRVILGLFLFLGTAVYGSAYVIGFFKDCQPATSRLAAATQLQTMLNQRIRALPQTRPMLGIDADPAPYNLPPFDLFAWRVVRLPRGQTAPSGTVVARPDQSIHPLDPRQAPISWANKRFEIK